MKALFTLRTSRNLCTLPICAMMAGLLSAPVFAGEATSNVVTADAVQWGDLNPLRGDQSPAAANLWGDRTKDTATGMLVRFKQGFESPPHIHNITYRGIVIEGQMHNDDPEAEKMWMPPGSFWTQPAGENHTTAANAESNMIYLEIDSGPYLVKPSDKQFDNGEYPLNLHTDNMVWLSDNTLNNITGQGVQLTYLWGSAEGVNGSMVKLPAGFSGEISTDASEFRAVVIAGEVEYSSKARKNPQGLRPGSYIESSGHFVHKIAVKSGSQATVYIRTNQRYQVSDKADLK